MKRQRVLIASFVTALLISGGLSAAPAAAGSTAPQSEPAGTVSAANAETDRGMGAGRGKAPTPTPEPSESGYYAPSSAMPDETIGIMADSSVITAGSCKYRQSADNTHISTSEGPRAASAHGYWRYYSGTCPSTADVDVTLQAAWCDNSGVCGWRTVGTGNADVRVGGGRGNRATAREECRDTRSVAYRSYVDVDLNGVDDPSGVTYSDQVDLPCYPSS